MQLPLATTAVLGPTQTQHPPDQQASIDPPLDGHSHESQHAARMDAPKGILQMIADTALATTILVAIVIGTNVDRMPAGLAEFLSLRVSVKNVLLLTLFTCAWPFLLTCCGVYERRRSAESEVWRLIAGCTVGTAVALVFPLTSVSGTARLGQLWVFWASIVAAGIAMRAVRWRWSRRRLAHQQIRVVILGTGRRAMGLYQTLSNDTEVNYDVVGFVDGDPARLADRRLCTRALGTLDELEALLMRQAIDEVFIALPVSSQYLQIQQAIRICEEAGVRVKYPADLFKVSFAQPRYESVHGQAMVAMHMVADGHAVMVKRVMDVAGAATLLLLCAPLMACAALAIKLTTAGPTIFAQERYGLNKRRFRMYKFRTMVVDAERLQGDLERRNEADGPVFKIRSDPRVTRIGRLLRATSIDELPQLWNVLCGDMSLVGPRPLPARDVRRFTRPSDMRRFSVRPGLTCLWQVNGRSNVGFQEWMEMDLHYIDKWSLALDLVILARTIPAVLRGTGAS
jgi:exopolysaccharide biosynthesis polyprenyl glycosylphosphotransferase